MARKRTKKPKATPLPPVITDAIITVTKVLYHGETDWTIVLFESDNKDIKLYLERGMSPKAVGSLTNADVDSKYRVTLRYENTAYGDQFTIKTSEPLGETVEMDETVREEIRKLSKPASREMGYLLLNGFIPYVGIGGTIKMIRKYGEDLWRLPEFISAAVKDPLHEIAKVFDNTRADESFYENYPIVQQYAKLNAFFQGYMSAPRLKKLYDLLGKAKTGSFELHLMRDPFVLVGLGRGFTYNYMNKIIKKLNLPNYSEIYFRAAILEALRLLSMEGDCFGREKEIIAKLQELLEDEEFDADKFETTLCQLIDERRVIVWDNDIYSRAMFNSEQIVGRYFAGNNIMAPTYSPELVKDLIVNEEKKSGISYETTQKQALWTMNNRKVSVITGGPGTGKSTVIKLLVKLWLLDHDENSVALLAPTGKAAQRMADIVGLPASTIHRWVGRRMLISESDILTILQNPINCNQEIENLIIIDETSMLDINIAAWMVRAIGFNAKIVLVGDNDQLPSIGPGLVLNDLLKSLTTTRLQIQHRSVPSITWNASQFNAGNARDLKLDEHFRLICLEDDQDPSEFIKEEYKRLIDKYGLENVGLLCPKRKESSNPKSVTASNLNKYFQGVFHKPSEKKCENYFIGDRVIQCRNNYGLNVFNGEIGTVIRFVLNGMVVQMDGDHREVFYSGIDLDDLDLAYAISIHKSQGSEFAACVIPILNADIFMLQRNLIYTAVTRCKQEVVLITNKNKRPLHIGVYKNPIANRNSNLALYFK